MKKILIIEDDVALGDILNQKMQANGYEVKLCRDGKDGFDSIKTFVPDLILLDIILPSMNGYEILEAKARDSNLISIPVIIISNSGQPVEISRTLTLGVKDYIIKAQFDVDEVLVKVRQQFEGKTNDGEELVSLSGKKIMLVEDDQFLGDLVARKISSEGGILLKAGSGEDALNVLKSEKPDALLLDILLPGISGFDVLENIKKDDETKGIPVILFSNFGQKTDADKGKELGAARMILKAAVSLDEVIKIIKQVLAEIKTGGSK